MVVRASVVVVHGVVWGESRDICPQTATRPCCNFSIVNRPPFRERKENFWSRARWGTTQEALLLAFVALNFPFSQLYPAKFLDNLDVTRVLFAFCILRSHYLSVKCQKECCQHQSTQAASKMRDPVKPGTF